MHFFLETLGLIVSLVSTIQSQHVQVPLNSASNKHDLVKVAIIGAGAAGSSAAYHLQQFAKSANVRLDVTVYEREARAGGRSTTVNVLDHADYPVELGASIFVKVNEILYNATENFGLDKNDGLSDDDPEAAYALGIWDGSQWAYRQPRDGPGWWDMAKLFWRYGLAPLRTQRLMNSTVSSFLTMYQEPIFPWPSLTRVAQQIGLTDFTASTGSQILSKHGIGERWAREIIQSSTRVNYGQNLATIHGLETMVCMATDDAYSVRGGNWQIFEAMLNASHSHVKLGTTVRSIESRKVGSGHKKYTIESLSSTTSDPQTSSNEFDIVILAAPLQFANITMTTDSEDSAPLLRHVPDKIPYVSLYVTLLATPNRISPSFFGAAENVEKDEEVPSMILTTLAPEEPKGHLDTGVDGVGAPGFWSINLLRTVYPTPTNGATEKLYVYKVFSPAPLNATFVSEIFSIPYDPSTIVDSPQSKPDHEAGTTDDLSRLPISHLPWHYTRQWYSYPYLFPRMTFDELRLDADADGLAPSPKGTPEIVLGSLWYTSSIESFISTMETSALMGMNVARLVVDGLRP